MMAQDVFRKRLEAEWLPSCCDARDNFVPEGFRWESVERLTVFDARWFMIAVNSGLVVESAGFFRAPRSKFSEQLFWSGLKNETPRTFTLFLEPIITIGALARLNAHFDWPAERMGCQSEDLGLDLMCYDAQGAAAIGCEVKKTEKEVDNLLRDMRPFALDPSLGAPDKAGPKRNAWKKVASLRNYRPPIFWAVGPEGIGYAFQVAWRGDTQAFDLEPQAESILRFGG